MMRSRNCCRGSSSSRGTCGKSTMAGKVADCWFTIAAKQLRICRSPSVPSSLAPWMKSTSGQRRVGV
ncbi:MAG: hypothetical protein HY275_00240 [Gemmatimonadetes bacterium]|nr:hypothetical protein [Gemmatimonadota bacterium]